MSVCDDLLGLVERIALRLPGFSRLVILDALETECERLGADSEPHLLPLVGPAALWRLQTGPDPAL